MTTGDDIKYGGKRCAAAGSVSAAPR